MITYIDGFQLKGIFEMRTYKVIMGRKILIDSYKDNNLVVNLGKEKIVKLLANNGFNNYIAGIGFGTNTSTPSVIDTSITDVFIKTMNGYSFPSQTSVKFEWDLELAENNGMAIAEYGLLCQDGTLFARKVRGIIDKESDVLIEGSWTIVII